MVLVAPAIGVKSRDAEFHFGTGPLWSSRNERALFRYTATRLVADAAAIRTPTLVLTGGGDRREASSAQLRFFDRLGASVKRMHVLPNTEQDRGHDENRRLLADEVRRFMSEAFQGDAARQTLLDADRNGYTRQEYDRLTSPLPSFSPKGLYYALSRALNRSLALVSPGMRLGWQTGFDSGEMLDYAYQNQAHGDPLLGRWIDRIFLNNLGWKACRRRKQHTEIQLREAIARVRAAGQPVRLLDVAAGPGRYVLETVRALGGSDISALLRDNIAANLEAGRKLAADMSLQNVSFELGDAFDEQSLAQIQPPPNVVIACGFYELFSDNQLVLRSLRGLAAAMQGGGYLIHTGQPWNPHLELIARTLVNRTGAPAVMRRRTQEELDDLVRAAGFEKTDMKVDEFGVFTVSLARRV
jgi:SAM-dependent methyltransferase